MELYETEEQQINALKKWWETNKNSVVSGVVGGVIIIGGWNFWQNYQKDSLLKASSLYEEMLQAVQKNENESAIKISERINNNFSSTPYAVYAKLFQAKVEVDAGDLEAGIQTLQTLVTEADDGLKHIANIRLIQLLLANGEYEQGLQRIAEVDQQSSQSFTGNYEELKGDLYVALGREGEARTAYQNALRSGQSSPLLQYKIDDLTAPELLESNA